MVTWTGTRLPRPRDSTVSGGTSIPVAVFPARVSSALNFMVQVYPDCVDATPSHRTISTISAHGPVDPGSPGTPGPGRGLPPTGCSLRPFCGQDSQPVPELRGAGGVNED